MAPKSKSVAPRVSKQKKKVSIPREKNSQILSLPRELREQIYQAVLDISPTSLYDLLLINRQISGEAKPYLFQQTLIFDGQSELQKWLKTIDHSFLKLVVAIQFKLHDVDPDEIVGALGKRLRRATASGSSNSSDRDEYSEACELDVRRLEKAFRLFPNVKHFTIAATTKADPQPPSYMLASFVRLLIASFPNLISLTSHDDLPMEYVHCLRKLRRLRFRGIGTNSSLEVANILGNLPSLVELEVYRPAPDSAEASLSIFTAFDRFRYDIGDIVGEISDLESLTLYEYMGKKDNKELPREVRVEMTDAFMGSISALERHRPTLRHLTILIDVHLEPSMQKQIAMFVKSSHLLYLETIDRDFPPLGYLPATIETIVLRGGLHALPFRPWLEKLVAMVQHYNGELPNLVEVVIYRNGPSTPSDENHKRWASAQMRNFGIQAWWRVWDGKPPRD